MEDGVSVAIADATAYAELAGAFRSWPKPPELFEGYKRRAGTGEIAVLVARIGGELAGYCLIEWRSTYPPFALVGMPEIVDLNVLPALQGNGAARALMDEAELLAGTRSSSVGLRVGLYSDYGRAQRLYVQRGYLPDGAGISIAGETVSPGTKLVLDDEPVLAMTLSVGEASDAIRQALTPRVLTQPSSWR